MELQDRIDLLYQKPPQAAYESLKYLEAESENSSAVYPWWDTFVALMEDQNSYRRNRGLRLLAVNAKWDRAGRLDDTLALYLTHIQDPKPITARQSIQNLPLIAQARPDLIPTIRHALQNADFSGYGDSMRPLLLGDTVSVLKELDGLEEGAAE